MAKAPLPLRVQLFARPQPQPQTSTVGATSPSPSSTWTVDIYVAGEKFLHNVLLRDPLNPDQRSLCRWYLEQYVQRSPYSVDLAKDAEHLLSMYPEELLSQLQLQDVLAPCLLQEAPGDQCQRVVSIEICDEVPAGGGYESTVHQIFWETLENSSLLSNSGWSVIVHRTIQSLLDPGLSLPHRVQSWKRADRATATINILLVIARDISRNATVYKDITPFLASSALAEVQRQLEETGATLQLHVEIARPGTLASFEAHLRQSENIHGPGYFHIVHFDLHGKVGTRARKLLKYGFLEFCDEKLDKTVSVAAHKVGKILKKYNVSCVILNACESGRANCGDDANIAKIFQKHGVRNILAMSFKITSSAAELFLSAFYHGLLVDGSSFAASAAGARRALYLRANRPARFGLRRALLDSFVPVVYGSGQECVFISAEQEMRRSPSKFVNSSIAGNNGVTLPPVSEVLGRDFDVLRLEKLLLQGGLVCVDGLAGVGKSAFLRYASSMWTRTAFVDAVITIDFAKGMILSEQDFINAILGQLLQFTGQRYRTRLWTVNSLSLQSHDSDAIKLIIAELLRTLKVVIILDGLEIPFTPFDSSLVPGTLDAVHAFEIWQSIKSIFLPVQAPKTDNGWYLIATTRRQNTEWLTSLTSNQSGAQCFELRGLELPDAIELSQKVISAGGENVEQWNHEDCDWLEAIIDLLQGIPLALLEILPAQRALNIPWRLFHSRLHSGLVTSPADLKWLDPNNCRFFDEVRHLYSVLSKCDFLFLSLFSNYWHEAPPLAVLQQLFVASINDSVKLYFREEYDADDFKARASSLSGLALDRGYLRVNSHGITPWVHPLLTVYGRAFAFQFNEFTGGKKIKQLIVDSIQCLSSLPPNLSSNSKEDLNIANKPPVGNANLLTCINFCLLGQSVIPVEQWPMQLFVASIFRFCYFPYVGTAPWISGKYYQLLKTFAGYFRAPISDELYGIFFSILVFVCFDRTGCVKWSLERCHELYQLGSNMIRILEQHYGQRADSKATLSKGSLLFAQLLLLLDLKREKEAESTWQALKSLKYELFHQLRQGLQMPDGEGTLHKSQEPCKDSSRSPTHEKDWNVKTQDKTYTLPLDSKVGIVYKMFGGMVDILLEHEIEFLPMKSEILKEPEKELKRDAQLRDFFYQYGKEFSRDELEEASRCSSRNLQAMIMNKKDERFQALDLLENAKDNGDWIYAFEQHQRMFFDAIYGCLFDEADEHIEACREIGQKLSDVTPDVESLAQLKEIVQERRNQYMLICSLFPSDAGGRQDALEIAQKLHQSLAEIAPEQVSLAERHCADIKKNGESGAYPTQLSRELIVKLTRKYGKKVQDPMWAMNLNATMESFARFISEVYDAIKAKQFDSCLEKLDLIDELMEKEEFLHDLMSEKPQTFKGIRDACERGSAFFKVLSEWHFAITGNDFDAAWSYMEDLFNFQDPPTYGWVCANDIAKMRAITEKEHLQHLMLDLQNAHSDKDLEKFSTIYAKVVKRWADGGFPSIDQSKMRSFKSDNLEWMTEQAIDTERWEDGLRFCNEYLIASAWELRENPRAHDQFLNIREQCESGLIQQSLNTAEANFDFETCLKLIDDWEKLWQVQNQTAERRRSSFLILSQKLLQFLKDCYHDCCVPCARWARLREQTVCTYNNESRNQEKRSRDTRAGLTTRHHDRNALRAPFGCSHHCQGGYCFFD